MKILFIRHGESTDDLDDQYGGWADFDLTPKGKEQLKESSSKVAKLNEEFSMILHSPLKRASQSAEVLSSELNIEKEEWVWLKEKNGYGLLSGMTKEDAKRFHPDLLQDMEDGYVFGSEPEDKFLERVIRSYEMLKQRKSNLICVTHGGYLSRLIDNLLDKKYVKAGDGGFVLVDTEMNEILESFNFELE